MLRIWRAGLVGIFLIVGSGGAIAQTAPQAVRAAGSGLDTKARYLGDNWDLGLESTGSMITYFISNYTDRAWAADGFSPTVFATNYRAPDIWARCDSLFLTTVEGAYADSLALIFGQAKILVDTLPRRIAGQYFGDKNLIVLSEQLGRCTEVNQARTMLAHEFAHAFQNSHKKWIDSVWTIYNISPPVRKFTNYASRNQQEHQAEVLAAAFGYLDIINRRGDRTSKIMLGDRLEDYAPGTKLWARIMLSHPLFREHYLYSNPQAFPDLAPLVIKWPEVSSKVESAPEN